MTVIRACLIILALALLYGIAHSSRIPDDSPRNKPGWATPTEGER